MPATAARRVRFSSERMFYLGMTLVMLAGLVLGFSRSFFFKPWFPGAHGAPEPFFYVHGVVFAAWFVLLPVQLALVTAGRVSVHRTLGWFGAGLAGVMVVLGIVGGMIAAKRPTGFVDVPIPPLQFLIVPLADAALFALFVALAVAKRRDSQSHKRYMLLATIAIVEAAVARWPFAFMTGPSPVPHFAMSDLFTAMFLIPMVVWDVVSRRRVHPVTAWGGLVLVAALPLRLIVAETGAWLAFAGWLVGLL